MVVMVYMFVLINMKKIILNLIISACIIPNISFAHPGRTDSSGGHTCRTNCASWGLSTGEYHYHRSKSVPQAKEPIKSTYGEQGTGYISTAPEYKVPKTTTVNNNSITTSATSTSTTKTEKPSLIKRFFNWLF